MVMEMERSGLVHRLVTVAVKEANSKTIDGVESCVDILRYLQTLNLDVKRLSHSKVVYPLTTLTYHENLEIRKEVGLLFNPWVKAFYSCGRDASSTCDKAVPVKPKKPTDATKVPCVSKKKQSDIIAVETKKRLKPIQKKKTLLKTQQVVKVSETVKCCPVLEKNEKEMLELFEIAKKSADVANAKGLLVSKTETSMCFDTLTLLLEYPISSKAPETRKIMDRLSHLTRHKDRKICNAASELFHHWRQNINQQTQQ